MPNEGLDAYMAQYAAATKTSVIVAPGPLRPEMDGAFRAVLYWVTIEGIPRIIVEDEPYHPVMELTAARLASARMESRLLSSEGTIEVHARKEVDDGQREIIVIAGPKRELKSAFAFIGHPV